MVMGKKLKQLVLEVAANGVWEVQCPCGLTQFGNIGNARRYIENHALSDDYRPGCEYALDYVNERGNFAWSV
jgi:hypothetical protein